MKRITTITKSEMRTEHNFGIISELINIQSGLVRNSKNTTIFSNEGSTVDLSDVINLLLLGSDKLPNAQIKKKHLSYGKIILPFYAPFFNYFLRKKYSCYVES